MAAAAHSGHCHPHGHAGPPQGQMCPRGSEPVCPSTGTLHTWGTSSLPVHGAGGRVQTASDSTAHARGCLVEFQHRPCDTTPVSDPQVSNPLTKFWGRQPGT